jgi:hypothetical protein
MRKGTKLATTLTVTAALVVGGATAAGAIDRVRCTTHDYLWVDSDQTTCWANAGYQYVTLYNVFGLTSGNNAGYLRGYANGYQYIDYFAKWENHLWSPMKQTVDVVYIA